MPLLRLLGSPALLADDPLHYDTSVSNAGVVPTEIIQELPIKQPLLFMSYLAVSGEWLSRDALLATFWPEESETKARHNLSQLLYHCKKLKWVEAGELCVEKKRVRFSVRHDVNAFREAISENRAYDAVGLYSGRLLEATPASALTSLVFEAWLQAEQQVLHSMWRDAALQVSLTAADFNDTKQIDDALMLLSKVLKEDALAEDVVQCYLTLSVKANKRQQGIRLFENFAKTLKEDLDIEPLAETQALVEMLKNSSLNITLTNEVLSVTDINTNQIADVIPLKNFPEAITAFVGRDIELAEFAGFFREEEMRLVTIQGPGGTGKTRLSIEVAKEHAADFADGAIFIPLAPLASEDYIPTTILEVLGVAVTGDTPVMEQLLAHFQGREYLLVFDNFEHIIEGSSLLLDLLQASPKTKLIVTSREALGFQGEWLYQLKGLPYPTNINEAHPEIYDSVKLFLRRARHTVADFRLTEENKQSIVALCQLLEGMPLALELSTAWLRVLSPEEVLQEIQENLNFLEAESQDLPERHRSLRAVFEHSWQLISNEEQQALMALSIFHDGFTKEAAKEVADTSLRTLLNLVNKSLIYKQGTGRFNQLATLKVFSADKLSHMSELSSDYQARYCNYFLQQAKDIKLNLQSTEQAKWLEVIDAEQANYRAVISSFIEVKDNNAIALANDIWHFWWLRGHYQEARALFKHLLDIFAYLANDPLIAEAHLAAGGLARLCEDHQASHKHFEQSIAIWELLDLPEKTAAPKGNLALLCRIEGDYERAQTLMSEILDVYRNTGDDVNVANTLNNMAAVAISMQDPERAWQLNMESLEIAQKVDETFIAARCLGNLAALSYEKSDYEQSLQFHSEAMTVFEKMQYPVGIAVEYQGMGDVAVHLGEHQKALQYFGKSLEVFKSIDDKRGIAEVLASFVPLTMKQERYTLSVSLIFACQTLHAVLGIEIMPSVVEEQSTYLANMPEHLEQVPMLEAETLGKQVDFRSVEELITRVFSEPTLQEQQATQKQPATN